MSNGRHTEQECTVCEDGTYIRLENEKVCDTCQHSPAKNLTITTEKDVWTAFQTYRRENEDYNGWYGPDRIKFVGGFAGPYFEEQ
jgi:hypothetical protein